MHAKSLVAEGELHEALTMTHQFLNGHPAFSNEVVMQEFWYRSVMQEIRNGAARFEDTQIQKNKIVFSLLQLLDEIKNSSVNPDLPEKVKFQKERFRRIFLVLPMVASMTGLGAVSLYGQQMSSTIFSSVSAVVIAASASGLFFNPNQKIRPFKLIPSFKNGLYGGLIGGLIAGIIIAIFYYYFGAKEDIADSLANLPALIADPNIPENDRSRYAWELSQIQQFPLLVVKVILFSIFVGSTSSLMHLAISWFERFESLGKNTTLLLGSLLGGFVAYAINGMIGVYLFIDYPSGAVQPAHVLIGGGIGSAAIILGTLFYEYAGQKRYIFLTLALSYFVAFLTVVAGIAFLRLSGLENYIYTSFWYPHSAASYKAGLLFGGVTGIVLGLIFGLTVYFYQKLKFEEKQAEQPLKEMLNPG